MHVRWTEEALSDLEDIASYIQQDSPSAAERITKEIVDAADSLSSFPHRGRMGGVAGTREWVLARLAYIITYEVLGDTLFIQRIHHGAQNVFRR